MGVSKNRGTPKWMVYSGKPYLKWMIWGGNPLFSETSIEREREIYIAPQYVITITEWRVP